jgi:hypothetical protein
MEKWKKELRFMELGRKPEVGSASIGTAILMKDTLMKDQGHLSECNESGSILATDAATIISKVEGLGGRLAYRFIGKGFNTHVWLWDESIVELKMNGKTYVYVTASSQNEKFIHDLRKMVRPYFQPAVTQGHVYAIVVQGGRLALNTIGNAGIPLVPENYEPSLIEDYKFVIRDLNSSTPSGRIIIMEGEPGTGKTHLVRAMLTEVKDAMFVLVSPEMVSSLGGPELLPLLLSHRSSQSGPIILILEDADKCLVTRAGDNINSIQSLLNLGDGILGSLLDLRIVATTNAKKLEMEPAIMRPGRLCKRMEVGPLQQKTACGVFRHLLADAPLPTKLVEVNPHHPKKFTLAVVYAIARDSGWQPVARTKVEEEEDDEYDPREVYDEVDEEEDYN